MGRYGREGQRRSARLGRSPMAALTPPSRRWSLLLVPVLLLLARLPSHALADAEPKAAAADAVSTAAAAVDASTTADVAAPGNASTTVDVAVAVEASAAKKKKGCRGRTRVLIVGAGIAGAAAANALTSASSCVQVTVLEGRNRVGGRMYSKTTHVKGLGRVRAELGGQWIESWEGNPITALARHYGLRIGFQRDGQPQYTARGHRYSAARLEAADEAYSSLVEEAVQYAQKQEQDIPLEAAFKAVNAKLMRSPYVQAHLSEDFEFEYGAFSDLSGYYYENDAFGGGAAQVLDGFDSIPKRLMADAQARGAHLRLNFIVSRIARRKGHGVVVSGRPSSRRQGPLEQYTADYVILTAPLGVLKAGTISFSPPLSVPKRAAMARLGFGFGTKVALFYRHKFWDLSADEYCIEDSGGAANRGRFPYVRSLVHPENQSGLIAYCLGGYARRMKGRRVRLVHDARLKIAAMFPAARKLQNKPVLSWVQDWGADPLARGSYSYAKVGTKGNGKTSVDFDTLSKPEGRLLFAGEHTHGPYRASVHGAYLSGLREAKRILKKI